MRVGIRVQPGASRDRVGGRYAAPTGDLLQVWVTARAVDGAANVAVSRVLAKALGVRPRQVALVGGQTSRSKIVELPDECSDSVAELLGP